MEAEGGGYHRAVTATSSENYNDLQGVNKKTVEQTVAQDLRPDIYTLLQLARAQICYPSDQAQS